MKESHMWEIHMCGIYNVIRESKKVRDEQIKSKDGSGHFPSEEPTWNF